MNNTTVPIEVWLPADTHRRLDRLARQDATRVDLLLAAEAERLALDVPLVRRRPQITPAQISLIRQLLTARMPVARIAELVGVSRTTVYNHLNKAWRES